MRFLSLILALMMCIPAHASTEGLARAYRELDFQLNVEGHAADPALRAQAFRNFEGRVRDLKAAGLTNQELIDFAVSQAHDRRQAESIHSVLTTIDVQDLSTAESLNLIRPLMEGPQGAAWLGSVLGDPVILMGLILITAALITAFKPHQGGDGTHDHSDGNEPTICTPGHLMNPECDGFEW